MPRFMMMIKGDPEPGQMPSEELLAAMGAYNEELAKAGVLLDLSGLHPSAEGARVKFSSGKRTVIDGPFTETSDVWISRWYPDLDGRDQGTHREENRSLCQALD